MDVKIDGTKLVITMDLQKPAPSKSGKTMVVATTNGNQATTCMFKGKALTLGVNAYYKP